MLLKSFFKIAVLAGLLLLHSIPFARASAIAYVDKTENKFIVASHFYFWGSKMTPEIVKQAVSEIDRMWNEPKVIYIHKGQEFPISFQFTYELAKPVNQVSINLMQMLSSVDATYVDHPYLLPMNGNTHFQKPPTFHLGTWPKMNLVQIEQTDPKYDNRSNFYCGGHAGKLLITDDLGKSTTAAHEYGHGLGLGHIQGSLCSKLDGPSIMCPRGSTTLNQFQYDRKATAGDWGGTLNPYYRKVRVEDILALELEKIPVNTAGYKIVGPHLKEKCLQNKL